MGVKISELGAAGALDGTEVFPIVQSGSTVKTNVEAGAELDFTGIEASAFWPGVDARRIDNDTLYCTAVWNEIPKQASTLSFIYPVGSLGVRDGSDNFASIPSVPTITNLVIIGKITSFRVISIGAFGVLTQTPSKFIHPGGTSKLLLT